MDFKKTFEKVTHRLGDQIADRLQRIDLEAVLGAVGLQLAKPSRSLLLPLVAALGTGVALGMALAPVSGKELRHQFMRLVKGKMSKNIPDGQEVLESPYDKAKAQQRDSDGTNGAKKVQRAADPTPIGT